MLADLELPLLSSELGYRVAYQEYLASGQSVAGYAPKDAAAAEVSALVDEVIAFANPQSNKEVA